MVRFSTEKASASLLSSGITHCNICAQLKSFEFYLHTPTAPHTFMETPFLLPKHSTDLKIQGASLSTTYNSALTLNALTLKTEYKDRKILFDVELQSLFYWYDHRDLTAFSQLISNLRSPSNKNSSSVSSEEKKLDHLRIFEGSLECIGCVVRLQEVGIGLQLPKGPSLYLLLYHSFMDSIRGTFGIEGFTSRLGKECCCKRPCKLSHCYCTEGLLCTTGKCLARRNSSCGGSSSKDSSRDFQEEPSGTPSPDDLEVLEGLENKRRRSASNQTNTEEVRSNFLGHFGKQMYMAGVGRQIVKNAVNSSMTSEVFASSPYEDLKFLASQRDHNSRKQHSWGSPLSIGVCHFKFPRPDAVFIGQQEEIDKSKNFSYGTLSRRSVGKMNNLQKRLLRGTAEANTKIGVKKSYFTSYKEKDSSSKPSIVEDEDKMSLAKIELDDLQIEWSPTLANLIFAVNR